MQPARPYRLAGPATLQRRSDPALDAIDVRLLEHPEIKRLEVARRTDESGSAVSNQELFERVVDSMISEGVEPGRISARGYGESKSIDLEKIWAAREQNKPRGRGRPALSP